MDQSFLGLQRIFVESDRRFVLASVVAVALAAGLAVGAYVAILSPLLAVVGVGAIAGGLLMLRHTQWGLIAIIGLICLLPFGALPFKIGFTPTFLDLALIAVYFVWIARIAVGKAGKFHGTALGLPIAVFMLLAIGFLCGGSGPCVPRSVRVATLCRDSAEHRSFFRGSQLRTHAAAASSAGSGYHAGWVRGGAYRHFLVLCAISMEHQPAVSPRSGGLSDRRRGSSLR